MKRAVIVLLDGSYRATDFLEAANTLRVDIVVATDANQTMADAMGDHYLDVDLCRPEWSAQRIGQLDPRPDAVVAVDDQGVLVAAMAAEGLGLPHTPVAAAGLTRDKAQLRDRLASFGVSQPAYRLAARGEVSMRVAELEPPCVVKPRSLSASRGVIKVTTESEATEVEDRIRAIVAAAGEDPDVPLLVEEYVAGAEVAVEGMVQNGSLKVLAILDKPDPLEGPFFEETMFVSPSRHPVDVQGNVISVTTEAVAAMGLVEGPVHAEIRIEDDGAVRVIEVAARSIGGLCARSLSFGLLGENLETLILRNALGFPSSDLELAVPATGVLMIPIPRSGVLREVTGATEARALAGITGVEITTPSGSQIVPLPEGDRYLGFVFATGSNADAVERTLREAQGVLGVIVD